VASIEEVKAQLDAAIQKANEGVSAHLAASSDVDEAIGITAAATEGTGHPEIDMALASFQAAQQKSEESIASIQAAITHLENYMAEL
jgi:hypothetical protein